MSKKNIKRKKEKITDDEALNCCPACGLTMSSTSQVGLNSLILSHAELIRALRLAGRWMVQVECPDRQVLEKMRQTLKEAEDMACMQGLPGIQPAKRSPRVAPPGGGSRRQRLRLVTPRSAAGS
jgi:hypothetical protein